MAFAPPKSKNTKSAVDLYVESDRTAFFVTFGTGNVGFPFGFAEVLSKWHVKKCGSCLLVAEGDDAYDSAKPHFHSVGTWKTMTTSNVTAAAVTLYSKYGVEYTKGVSVVVKKVSDLIGIWQYISKDVTEGTPPVLAMGWKMSWIKEICLANVHKIPYAVLMKKKHCLSTKTATALVMEYAKAKGHVLSGKESFASLICLMARDGYQFEAVKLKWLYCQCMSLCGDDRAMRSMVLNELNFLE